jgi:hypothetical protein
MWNCNKTKILQRPLLVASGEENPHQQSTKIRKQYFPKTNPSFSSN